MLSLNTAASDNVGWTMFNAIAQLFFILAAFAVVLFLAYYLTKWVGSAKYAKKPGGSFKLLDSMGFGFQNGIHLVKAGKKYILIGVTKDRITFLCELTKDDIDAAEYEKDAPSFENYLNKLIRKNKDG